MPARNEQHRANTHSRMHVCTILRTFHHIGIHRWREAAHHPYHRHLLMEYPHRVSVFSGVSDLLGGRLMHPPWLRIHCQMKMMVNVPLDRSARVLRAETAMIIG